MGSLIVETATRFLQPLLLMLSLFLLFVGHNEPGGGFAGGLVASAAFALQAIAIDTGSARRTLRANPYTLLGAGLLIAAGAGVSALVAGFPFLTGLWMSLDLGGAGTLKLGTPLLFDLGVYLVVVGTTMTIVFSLMED